MSTTEKPPKVLRGGGLTARVLRQKIWRPPNVQNNWSVFVFVGPEGSGKSLTTVSVLEKVDETFNAGRVHFSPETFLEQINDIPEDERQGKAVMIDEAGVGMGSRTWYDDDQIMLNKMMQTARDDNMIVGMTLPVLSELDSQMRNRLHGFCEVWKLHEGEYVEWSWKNYIPRRDESTKVYKKYPKLRIDGRKRKVKRLKIGPPHDEELVANYQEKKREFKKQLYEETLDGLEDDPDDEQTVRDIAMEITEDGVAQYVSTHNQTKQPYINKDLIRANYELSHADASAVKSLLEQQFSQDQLGEYT